MRAWLNSCAFVTNFQLNPYLMKKLFFLLVLCICSQAMAQNKREGYAIYELKRDMHANLTGEQEKYKAMMPQFFTSKFDFYFNAKESFLKYSEEEEDEEENPMGARIKMMRPNLEIHLSLTDKVRTELRGGMGKDFLITSQIKPLGWKLTEETAKIAGYDCKKATCTSPEGKPIVAWYAESIPVFMGPMGYNGLPGLILKLELENSTTVCELKKITFQQNKEKDIIKPTKGKVVTEEEFKEEMKKLMPQGGKNIKITTGN
ncbi:MAG: GLPGLI family protein [Bacteroidetes bacterium]|nr:MAG: GLPGLI family protein [Bacteroidota bacterium]